MQPRLHGSPTLHAPGFDAGGLCLQIDDALDAASCEALIAEAEARGFLPTGRDYPLGYRDNDRLVLDDPVRAAALYERLRGVLPARLESADGVWECAGLNPRFRYCRYTDGQSFTVHRDGAHHGGGLRSRLTLQFYLNDSADFVGGRTRFYATQDASGPSGAIDPVRGSAIAFDHALWHDGEPVVRGVKYVMRTDVLYRLCTPSSRAASITHDGYVFGVLALHDGRVATCSRDRTLAIWSAHADGFRRDASLRAHDASVTCMAEQEGLWSGSRDRTVRRWRDGDSRVVFRHEGAVLALASSPDGARVASASADGTVAVFEGDACVARLGGYGGWVRALAWRDASCLLSADEDGNVIEWDLVSRQPRTRRKLGSRALGLACSETGSLAVATGDGAIHVFGRDGSSLTSVGAHRGAATCVVSLPRGEWASGGEDGAVRVLEANGTLTLIAQHADFVHALAVQGERALLSASYDGTVGVTRLRDRSAHLG